MLRRWFGSGKKSRKSSNRVNRIEQVESRLVLSGVTVSFSGGYATVVGTSASESITLQDDGSGNLGVIVDGSPLSFTTQPLSGLIGFVVYGGTGNDVLTLGASLGAKQGFLYGQGGDDSLNGGTGLDRLYGGPGLDSYTGGAGQDNFFSDPDDYVSGVINVVGGAGTDILYLGSATSLFVSNAMQIEQVFGSSGNDQIDASAVTTGMQLFGQGGNDQIMGTAGNDIIHGGTGDDMLDGFSGNDLYRPGAGNDQINGTNDSISFVDVPNGLTIDIGAGTATGVGVNTLFLGILNADGTNHDDTIIGSAANNTINGKGGNDLLMGLGGVDSIYGGAGIDTVSYINSPTGVTVYLSGISPGVGGHAAGDKLFELENLTGSNHADVLEGTTGDNVINGLDGNDVIYGLQGNDVLTGGEGNDQLYGGIVGGTDVDTMDGGNGNDTFYADASDVDGSGNLLATGGAGNDTVNARAVTIAAVSWKIQNGIEVVNGTNNNDIIDASAVANTIVISGLNGNDTLTGGSGADFIYGGAGNDSLFGGSALDRLFGGDNDDFLDGGNDGTVDYLNGNAGTDTGELNGSPLDFAFPDVEILI